MDDFARFAALRKKATPLARIEATKIRRKSGPSFVIGFCFCKKKSQQCAILSFSLLFPSCWGRRRQCVSRFFPTIFSIPFLLLFSSSFFFSPRGEWLFCWCSCSQPPFHLSFLVSNQTTKINQRARALPKVYVVTVCVCL